MRFLGSLALIIIVGFVCNLIFPWWVVALAAIAVGFAMRLHGLLSFLCGFLALAILWGAHTWLIDVANQATLSTRIGELFKVSSSGLWWITIFIGGLLGGLAMTTGKFGADIVFGVEQKGSNRRKRR